MRKEVGEEEGMAQAAPQRESVAGSFALRLLSLAGGNLRGGLRGGFQWNIITSSGMLSGSRCPLIGQRQASLVTTVGSGVANLALLLFWAWS